MKRNDRSAHAPPDHSFILLSVPDWMTRNGIQRSLEHAGHRVHVVGSGALTPAEQKPGLALISTNRGAPVGTDPAVSLCASQEVPVIWLSTSESWEQPLQLFSIRTVGVLVQPVHERQLLAATAAALTLLAQESSASASARLGDEPSSHPISRAQLGAIVDALNSKCLTRRQSDLILMLLDGQRVPTIAERFGLEPSSVRAHLHRIYEKLEVHSQSQLVRLIRTGSRSDHHERGRAS